MLNTILCVYLIIGFILAVFIVLSSLFVEDAKARLRRLNLRMNFWYALFTIVFVTAFWLPNLIYGILRKRNG